MKRLTTDKPDNNVEAIANLVHCKDGWLYIRHAGRDVKATDFCLSMCKKRGCDLPGGQKTQEEKAECLCECLFEGCEIATVYAALCGFGMVRERLKMYEDAGMMPPKEDASHEY